MQNKANFLDIQMNVTCVKTKNYEQKTTDNEPIKQSQFPGHRQREGVKTVCAKWLKKGAKWRSNIVIQW
jgi:hypothetical protein